MRLLSVHCHWQHRAAIGFVAIVLLTTPLGVSRFEAHAESDGAAIKTLAAFRAGYKAWEADIDIACEFEYRHSYSLSIESALAGEFDDTLGPEGGVVHATGQFYKKGPLARCRFDYGAEPVALPETPASVTADQRFSTPQRVVTRLSYDAACNREINAKYMFPQSEKGMINRIEFSQLATPNWRTASFGNALSPLNPLQNAKGKVFELWDLNDSEHGEDVELKIIEEDRVVIRLRRHGVEQPQERDVIVWTAPSPPMVEKIIDRRLHSDGTVERIKVIALSEFVQCGVGMVARRIVSAKKSGAGPIRVRSWYSHDLGEREPRESDFIIRSLVDATVIGLSGPQPIRDGFLEFDMNRIGIQDIKASHPVVRRVDMDVERRAGRGRRVLLIINVALVVLVAALLVVFRCRRNQV